MSDDDARYFFLEEEEQKKKMIFYCLDSVSIVCVDAPAWSAWSVDIFIYFYMWHLFECNLWNGKYFFERFCWIKPIKSNHHQKTSTTHLYAFAIVLWILNIYGFNPYRRTHTIKWVFRKEKQIIIHMRECSIICHNLDRIFMIVI